MEGYIGEIRAFAGAFAPKGWAFCNGQLLSISDHEALYSLLGVGYGGNGVETFRLPDLSPLAPTDNASQGQYIICLSGIYPSRP